MESDSEFSIVEGILPSITDPLETFVLQHEGIFPIHSVLIANNGLAALKAIRSIRKWAFETFDNSKIITLYVMATKDDIESNTEFVRIADGHVEVPSGPNMYNYANVDLIVNTAKDLGVQAVWAGWGHASENPRLPEMLSQCQPRIEFIGPSGGPMRALGDKISSMILAQSADVKTIDWSGTGVKVSANSEAMEIDGKIYEMACSSSAEEGLLVAEKIGFPVMIKASEGGGGKGIRKVERLEQFKSSYCQVESEVPGSPIFIMKMAENSRHLEIQLVCDKYRNATALYGRDCTVQRRHQKIIEEAPISVAPKEIVEEMEKAAVRLGKLVGYEGVGTVEFLYSAEKQEYSFLELNPRLQVEHPTTEMVCQVNIPALQLMIAMGIPLYRIPSIRNFYSQSPKEASPFDFDLRFRKDPLGHVIAARITAENTDAGFKPNSGDFDYVHFPADSKTWGYFALSAKGAIHNFSDSQFGHVFSQGTNRLEACKILAENMKEAYLNANFRTNIEYVSGLLQHPVFLENKHTTSWLDGLIASNYRPPKITSEIAALCMASIISYDSLRDKRMKLEESLRKRQYPTKDQLELLVSGKFIYEEVQFSFSGAPSSATSINIKLGSNSLSVKVHLCQDKSYLVSFNGRTYLAMQQKTNAFIYLSINGCDCLFTFDNDPSLIRSPSSGRLVRYLVNELSVVEVDTPIAEIEVMKMFMTICSKAKGVISCCKQPGASISPGDLIANIILEDHGSYSPPLNFEKTLSLLEDNEKSFPNLKYSDLCKELWCALEGYEVSSLEEKVCAFIKMASDKTLLHNQIKEIVAVHRNKLPSELCDELCQHFELSDGSDYERIKFTLKKFPFKIEELEALLKQRFDPRCDYLTFITSKFLHDFVEMEAPFESQLTVEQPLTKLQLLHCDNYASMTTHVWSHSRIESRINAAVMLLDRFMLSHPQSLKNNYFLSTLKKISGLCGKEYGRLIRKVRSLLLESQLPSMKTLFDHMEVKFIAAANGDLEGDSVKHFIKEMTEGFSTHLDVLPYFFHHPNGIVRQLAIEISVRRIVGSHILECTNFCKRNANNIFQWTFSAQSFKHIENEDIDFSDSPDLTNNKILETPIEDLRRGFMQSVFSTSEIKTAIDTFAETIRDSSSREENVFYVACKESPSEGEVVFKEKVLNLLKEKKTELEELRVRRVTLILVRDNESLSVGYYTFRKSLDYQEDLTIRHIEPAMAYLLEFHRLYNYGIEFCFADIAGQLRIFLGTEKSKAQNKRLFVRLVVRPNQAMKLFNSMEHFAPEASRILEETLQALEGIQEQYRQTFESNHLFINIVPVFYNTPKDVLAVFKELVQVSKDRWAELHIRQAEVRMNLAAQKGATPSRYRFFLNNKTGYVPEISGYLEKKDPHSGFKYLASLESVERREFDGFPVSFRYPMISPLQIKRTRVQKLDTPYVYDFPAILEHAAASAWAKANKARPDILMVAKELMLDKKGCLVEVKRAAGNNTCGMVSWKMTLFTPEAPNGREVIVIANDISHEIGSFGVEEDRLFYEASKLARSLGIPRIYLSANSGARIGLAEELRNMFHVAWKDPENPFAGFDYIYLSEGDYKALNPDIVNCERICVDEEVRYKVLDIIGAKNGLGVENLQGSALIAGETSLAYDQVFTLSFVTCRSVGIGAYLVRLGQRTIQKSQHPIILTGVGALNNLLGKEVYRNNMQIGGPQIMFANGITHRVVTNDLDGMEEIINWLTFVPLNMKMPMSECLGNSDNPERDVEYYPPKDEGYDPRWLIEGKWDAERNYWTSGFFDKGTFVECLGGWAKTVVTGRARLGGIPVGVIAVETRTVEQIIPSDPANQCSEAQVIRQAGQVWFPDSAFKTAQAIRDFSKGENLPIFILANWRGFSGGQRDLYDQILKFGSQIVDALKAVTQPVFVYLPPGGELRGGAWVVLDSNINPEYIEMFADPTSRGGVLEPEGIVGIKFRQQHLNELMEKSDPICKALKEELDNCDSTETANKLSARKAKLSSIYRQVACHFADAHDRPGRMKAKNAIKDIVPWAKSRSFFYQRLCRMRLEMRLLYQINIQLIESASSMNCYEKSMGKLTKQCRTLRQLSN